MSLRPSSITSIDLTGPADARDDHQEIPDDCDARLLLLAGSISFVLVRDVTGSSGCGYRAALKRLADKSPAGRRRRDYLSVASGIRPLEPPRLRSTVRAASLEQPVEILEGGLRGTAARDDHGTNVQRDPRAEPDDN